MDENSLISVLEGFNHLMPVGLKYNNYFVDMFVRPLQFNYLSYELFLEKKSCQTPKKKKKKSSLVSSTDGSGFEIFCQTPKKKKKCKFNRLQEAIIVVVEPQT